MKITYQTLKDLAKERGCRVTDLIALAPQNDPFYTGTSGEMEKGRWFADLWSRFGYNTGVHLRRVHYQLISQPDPRKADGSPYQNTENDWNYLLNAGKYARYLNLVNPDAFEDRRNPDPLIIARYQWDDESPGYGLNNWEDMEITLPEYPELPAFSVYGFDVNLQPYHLEVWVEKTTMNDVLLPLCYQYKTNLVTGAGEMSITAVVDLIKRVEEAKRPARIFYVSDFDPAGYGMPISVARKIEFLVDQLELDLDIRLEPVALTRDQVRDYSLPRTPIKESELRKGNFEAIHGQGAVELDALEALHPGALRAIVGEHLDRYYDHEIEGKLRDGRRELNRKLRKAVDNTVTEILEDYPEWETLEDRFNDVVADFRGKIDPVRLDLAEFVEELERRLDDITYELINPEDYFPNEVKQADEENDVLFDSRRDYGDQLLAYKLQRLGKGA